jgi:hypothetical protein
MGKKSMTGSITARLAEVRKRGKVFAQKVGVRANIIVSRRRLRRVFAELGENVYGEMASEGAKGREDAPGLAAFKIRIDGLKGEIHQQEEKLTKIMAKEDKVVPETKSEKNASED